MTPPSPAIAATDAPTTAALLAAAMKHHRDGNLDAAVALYRQVLAREPQRTNVLFLLGFALSQGIDVVEGEALLLRYVALAPRDAAALHAIGKVRQNQGDEAGAIAWFEKALTISPNDSPSWNDLGTSLHRSGRLPEAVEAFSKALASDQAWALPHYNLATVHYDMGNLELAEAEYRACLARDPNLHEAYSMLASTVDQLHRPAEAEAFADAYARHVPLVIKACKNGAPRARVLIVMAAGMCNFRTDYLFDLSRYETATVYVRSGKDPDPLPALDRLPPFDLVFSAIADPDRATAFIAETRAFCQRLGQPVMNAPDVRIDRTRRDLLPALLDGIPNVVTPATRRVAADELTQLATEDRALDPPLLVRPCGFHGGKFFKRLTHTSQLATALREAPYPLYYVSPYHDYRNADGNFRKYRFIFVDREPYPYHLAVSPDWLVHYFRTDMQNQAWMRAEEEAFLADYTQLFSPPLCEAIRAVGKALDLDYAGMDCAITPDGRLLVFEANAAMLVHLNDDPVIYAYKHRYVPRIAAAMDAMVDRWLARP